MNSVNVRRVNRNKRPFNFLIRDRRIIDKPPVSILFKFTCPFVKPLIPLSLILIIVGAVVFSSKLKTIFSRFISLIADSIFLLILLLTSHSVSAERNGTFPDGQNLKPSQAQSDPKLGFLFDTWAERLSWVIGILTAIGSLALGIVMFCRNRNREENQNSGNPPVVRVAGDYYNAFNRDCVVYINVNDQEMSSTLSPDNELPTDLL